MTLIAIPLLNEPFSFYKDRSVSKSEKRTLARKPFFDVEKLDPYPGRYEKWYNDHFPWREEMIRKYTLFNFRNFSISPLPDQVIIGKNNWLFLTQREKMIYCGDTLLTDAEVDFIVKYLKERTHWHEENGMKFYVAFAPMKQEIYPEYLPASYSRGKNGTLTDRIIAGVKKEPAIPFIELKPALIAAKGKGRLYGETDNHWNDRGAYYAYREIIRRIRKDFPQVGFPGDEDVTFSDTLTGGGNLAHILDLADYMDEQYPKATIRNRGANYGIPAGYKPPYPFDAQYEFVMEKKDTNLPKAVIIRDSFGGFLAPYLSENFRKSVYIFDIWNYDYNQDIISNEKPDLVLLVIYEPHIHNLLDGK